MVDLETETFLNKKIARAEKVALNKKQALEKLVAFTDDSEFEDIVYDDDDNNEDDNNFNNDDDNNNNVNFNYLDGNSDEDIVCDFTNPVSIVVDFPIITFVVFVFVTIKLFFTIVLVST
jgi:hypothetical protein